jgi:pyruvate/2-oxoglutarate dehydrogenase complex dihydrolipoamide dehydrogenase (E3) component
MRLVAMRCTGEEVLDLVEQPVDVSASGEPQSVVPGLLEVAGAGYMGCEVASVARGS